MTDEQRRELVWNLCSTIGSHFEGYARNVDGVLREADDMVLSIIGPMQQQINKAEDIIARHDLCHNMHGQVDARAFADGCAAEQRKLYGCAPDADRVAELEDHWEEHDQIMDAIQKLQDRVDSLERGTVR